MFRALNLWSPMLMWYFEDLCGMPCLCPSLVISLTIVLTRLAPNPCLTRRHGSQLFSSCVCVVALGVGSCPSRLAFPLFLQESGSSSLWRCQHGLYALIMISVCVCYISLRILVV